MMEIWTLLEAQETLFKTKRGVRGFPYFILSISLGVIYCCSFIAGEESGEVLES